MQVYKDAQQFLLPSQKKGSLQTRIFETCKNSKYIKTNPKHLFALVSSTLKYKPFIQYIMKKTKIMELEKKAKIPEPIFILMIHDLLFSKSKRIQSKQHAWKDAIIRNKPRLEAELARLKIKNGVKSLDELIEDDDTPVRWFRTNLLKTNTDSLLREFSHLRKVDSLTDITSTGVIYHDDYIPNLFGIHPKEKLTSTDAYKQGRLIIQDRASCFPAQILDPIPGKDKVIDACAAPGNKTTHLASILNNSKRSIIAFEKDNKRVKTLRMMCEKAGGLDCITIQHADFTSIRPQDFPEITGMVVDPSCSGSGIFGRAFDEQEEISEEEAKEKLAERLQRLSGFQYKIVKHALSFPNVRKVVYSTCSIHDEENEGVVRRLLEDIDVQQQGWTVSKRENVLPNWPRRGHAEVFDGYENKDELADGCVRSLPKVDGGIGFFAVSFERNLCENKGKNNDDANGDTDSDDEYANDEEEWTGIED
jgi:putative methyltransferase